MASMIVCTKVCTVISVVRRRHEVRGGTSGVRMARGRIREQLRLQSSTARSTYCIMRHKDRRDINEKEKRRSGERQ